jgi:hypothetical protein
MNRLTDLPASQRHIARPSAQVLELPHITLAPCREVGPAVGQPRLLDHTTRVRHRRPQHHDLDIYELAAAARRGSQGKSRPHHHPHTRPARTEDRVNRLILRQVGNHEPNPVTGLLNLELEAVPARPIKDRTRNALADDLSLKLCPGQPTTRTDPAALLVSTVREHRDGWRAPHPKQLDQRLAGRSNEPAQANGHPHGANEIDGHLDEATEEPTDETATKHRSCRTTPARTAEPDGRGTTLHPAEDGDRYRTFAITCQKVHAPVQVRDPGLVLVEDQTPGCQPVGKPRLDLLGLLTGVTQGEQIVGLCRASDYADCVVKVLVSGVDPVRWSA